MVSGKSKMAQSLKKLHLGCGKDIKEGWINIDIKNYGQEIIRDLRRGLPFDDNSIDEIFANNVLEHISAGEELLFVISEIYRVLKKDGVFELWVPHTGCKEAFLPDHCSFWNETTIEHLIRDEYQGHFPFEILEIKTEEVQMKVKLKK